MERGPFSYTDRARVEQDLREAGFESIQIETADLSSLVVARDAACGIVLGSPFRDEIERLDASALQRATAAVEQALRPWTPRTPPCRHTSQPQPANPRREVTAPHLRVLNGFPLHYSFGAIPVGGDR